MRKVIEFFLIVVMAFFLGEVKYHIIENIVATILQKNQVRMRITPLSLTHYRLQDIAYKNIPIAKDVTLSFELLPLLDLVLYIDKIDIVGLNLNSLQKLAQHKSSSKSFFTFFIQKLSINAKYRYKDIPIKIALTAKDVATKSAQIKKLHLLSPYGWLRASGLYANQKLRLTGALQPILPNVAVAKTPFIVLADKKKIDFSLSTIHIGVFKANITNVQAKGRYDYKKLQANIFANVRYKDSFAKATAQIFYDKALTYTLQANIHNKKLPLPIAYQAYKAFKLTANGDLNKTTLHLSNSILSLSATIDTNKHFTLQTNTITAAKLNNHLPKDMRITLFAQGSPQKIDAKLLSNYLVVRSRYANEKAQANIEFLRSYHDINLTALNPCRVTFSNNIATLTSPLLQARFKKGSAAISLPKTTILIQKEGESITADIEAKRLDSTLSALQKLYPLPTLPFPATLDAHIAFNLKKSSYDAALTLNAKQTKFEYFTTSLHGTLDAATIDYYALVYNKHGFYATKPSTLLFDFPTITLQKFWIEDKISVSGTFDTKKRRGDFNTKASHYHYSSIEGSIDCNIDLHTTIDNEKISTQGDLFINSGVITYNPKRIRTVKDEDIIIVDSNTTQNDFFRDNIALYIKVDARNILYKQKDIFLLLRPDILLYKEYQKPLQILGLVHIVRGKYNLLDGYLQILPSTLSFYGKPTDPLLDMHLKTRKSGYIIFIDVSGDVQNPIVHFDSEPYLKPNDILALLAFGSRSSSLISSALGGGKFTSMLSSFFIKDMLKRFGIALDTLSLITSSKGIGFEIGKRITDKITILYKNDAISTIVIRYEFNNHIESEAIFGPNGSGLHLYYRNER